MIQKALIYQSELDYMSRCILDYPDIETGGDLFGFWTYSGFPVVQYVIGPGKDTYRTVAFFKQDLAFLEENGEYLSQRHGLQHLGNWHSHHRLGIPHPSGHDSNTMANAIANGNRNQFFLIIGSIKNSMTNINGFLYTKESGRNYSNCSWVVLPGNSPIRMVVSDDIKASLYHQPQTRKSKIGELAITTLSARVVKQEPLLFDKELWYTSNSGKEFLKSVYPVFNALRGEVKMFQTKEKQLELHLTDQSDTCLIRFPKNFPIDEIIISNPGYPNMNYIKRKIISSINNLWNLNLEKNG